MFDLNANDGSVRRREYQSPIPGDDPDVPAQAVPENKLDSGPMVDMHHRMLDLYGRELERQYENRRQMAIDEDFYDNIQWSEEDAAEVEERGQKPISYNVISASVDWVTGTERRARADFKVLPRRKEQGKPAQRKSELMKYLSDVNRTPFHRSRAFSDSVKVGLGWLEEGIQDDSEEEQLYSRYENWRNMLWDSASTENDLKDGRYIFRSKWVDLDVAKSQFPKRHAVIEQSAADSDSFTHMDFYGDEAMDSQELEMEGRLADTGERIYGYQRRRIRLIEGWIRVPVTTRKIRSGTFKGELYDPYSPGHREEVEGGMAEVVTKTTMRMHVGIFCTAGLLWLSESPYRHNRFPFIPIWGKRRGRDGLPYGMIRGLRDIQEDINKRASKALYILSTNKIIMDEGAVEDIEELRDEAARPDAILAAKQGYRLELNADTELSQYQLDLMGRNIQMIQQASGVTDELLGRRTNATSGVAIQRRQDQGSMATALYFDNLRFAAQLHGEIELSNIEQFMSEEKAFRITSERGTPEYVEINDGLPDNDIVRSKADFIISEADWRASLRQAAVDELIELMGRVPENVAMALLDLVVENMDIPNRDEIVKRIRAITGQRDPDAEELTPEEQQRAQANAEAQEINRATAIAELRRIVAEATKDEADAQATIEELVGKRVETQETALEAAEKALSMPGIAHTADHILSESGFQSQTDRQIAAEALVASQQQKQRTPGPGAGAPPPAPQPGAAGMGA